MLSLTSALQICTKIDTIYLVAMPADVRSLLDRLSVVVGFGLNGMASTPLACVGLAGYLPTLLFWMIMPPIIGLVVVVVVIILAAAKRTKSKKLKMAQSIAPAAKLTVDDDSHAGALVLDADVDGSDDRQTSIFEKALPLNLKVLFILYPMVTRVAFEGFPCYEFGNGRGWLMADVSIECNTEAYSKVTMLAWTAVIVYPIGMWTFNLVLLLLASRAILSGKHTPLSRSISFLYRCAAPCAVRL